MSGLSSTAAARGESSKMPFKNKESEQDESEARGKGVGRTVFGPGIGQFLRQLTKISSEVGSDIGASMREKQ